MMLMRFVWKERSKGHVQRLLGSGIWRWRSRLAWGISVNSRGAFERFNSEEHSDAPRMGINGEQKHSHCESAFRNALTDGGPTSTSNKQSASWK
ncbi:hypothetical protein SISSUDRAFT_292491 [Sistotremastrum suecicum HHB10207 ss-3]|uniref:Uncharacterized protein n=1 Tax=Sistotremastrum suecicum HHB10207 ss-3 TaxID=1314776 RepID=A0A165ZIR8_9AGAM|nr:hypothetical protein SISSUDRAFT_292491 [Sistotremastrum suecicum HHB10207 ss-3]